MNIKYLPYRLRFIGIPALAASLSFSFPNILTYAFQSSKLPQVRLSYLEERVAQSNLPEYVCQLGVEQTNLSPPNANYKSSIICGRGTPIRLNLNVYKANVNFPNEFI
jgi:hypothetical protein